MTEHDDGIDPVAAERIGKNIDLAFRFLGELIDDPVRLDHAPNGSSLIVLPYDDPELGVLNLGQASKLAAAGHVVRLQRVGVPKPGEPGWPDIEVFEVHSGHLAPKWPVAAGGYPVAGYDPGVDALTVELFATPRPPSTIMPINAYVWMLVDMAADEAVGLLVPHFRSRVMEEAPLVGEFLLLSFGDVVGISKEEAHRLRDEIGFGQRPVHPQQLAELGAVTKIPARTTVSGELARLIA